MEIAVCRVRSQGPNDDASHEKFRQQVIPVTQLAGYQGRSGSLLQKSPQGEFFLV